MAGVGSKVGLLACLGPVVLALLVLGLPVCCCGFIVYYLVGSGTLQKQELVWPSGVTPVAGGSGTGAIVAPADAGDPGYATYRSVGWEITSPYGWRPYMDEDLLPVPGEYEFHDGIDLAGPGLQFRDPLYPPLDAQPFFIGFYHHNDPYYGGAGEAVVLWNVHSTEETPVYVLFGHLEPYRIEIETYCRAQERYEPNIPIAVTCPGPVVAERGSSNANTGSAGKVLLFNGTPGDCTARVYWSEDYEVDGQTVVTFDQQIDEVRGVAHDALVRFYGCHKAPTPTATPSETPTPGGGPAGVSPATVTALPRGGGPAARGMAVVLATATRLPSPTRPDQTPPPNTPSPPAPTPPPATAAPTETPGPPLPSPTGATATATRLPSPTRTATPTPPPAPTWPPGTMPATAVPTLWPTVPVTPGPTWPAFPTSTSRPWPTPGTPGPTGTAGPIPTRETPWPSLTPGPRPTTVPHECPIGANLCYFPGFGPPLTLASELKQGQAILGYVGNSGRSTGPHLHLAVSVMYLAQIDVLAYYRPTENSIPVPAERLHYADRYPQWQDPLQFLPQAHDELGLAFMDQPLQLPPGQIIPEAGEGTWHSPADAYSDGGGGRVQGFDLNRLLCGWFGWLCHQ